MAVWILKTEPADCSLDDIRDVPGGIMRWDGIRNYQARNNLRAMRKGDVCLVYYAGSRSAGIAGSAAVLCEAYPDPVQFDPESPGFDRAATPANPRWLAVDIRYHGRFPRRLSVVALREHPALESLVLLRQGRLSVSPVSAEQWPVLAALLGESAP